MTRPFVVSPYWVESWMWSESRAWSKDVPESKLAYEKNVFNRTSIEKPQTTRRRFPRCHSIHQLGVDAWTVAWSRSFAQSINLTAI